MMAIRASRQNYERFAVKPTEEAAVPCVDASASVTNIATSCAYPAKRR